MNFNNLIHQICGQLFPGPLFGARSHRIHRLSGARDHQCNRTDVRGGAMHEVAQGKQDALIEDLNRPQSSVGDGINGCSPPPPSAHTLPAASAVRDDQHGHRIWRWWHAEQEETVVYV